MSFQAMTWAVDQKTPDSECKLILLILANYAGHDGSCWPSIHRIARETLLSESTVRRRLASLEQYKFISVTLRPDKAGDSDTNLYRLMISKGVVHIQDQGVSTGQGGGVRLTGGVVSGGHPNQSIEPVNEPKRGASISKEVEALHSAYEEAIGYTVEINQAIERYWFDASKCNLTPDSVKLVVKERSRGVKSKDRKPNCLMIRNLAGSDEAIADVQNEAAAIRARMRVKTFCAGKAQVLRDTGRPDAPEQPDAKPIGDYIAAMRRTVG